MTPRSRVARSADRASPVPPKSFLAKDFLFKMEREVLPGFRR